ncbi:MAG TPA: hypothetical protein VG819_01205 [Rhizomicrobium sp.]|jgi:hypothetical protein|nr:hypothetical protein [Rhizomicrobium sp.]
MSQRVSLALDDDEALVFFELAHRLAKKGDDIHSAERAVLDILIVQLERTLTTPFAMEYGSALNAARSRVAEKWGRA